MDLTIVRWAAEHLHGPFLDTVMPYITALGDSGFIWVVICFVLLARKKTRRAGIFCGLSLLIAYVSGEVVLKNLIQRPASLHAAARRFAAHPPARLLLLPIGAYGVLLRVRGRDFPAQQKVGRARAGAGRSDRLFPALPVGPLSDRPARGRAARGGKRAARALALPQAAAADAGEG